MILSMKHTHSAFILMTHQKNQQVDVPLKTLPYILEPTPKKKTWLRGWGWCTFKKKTWGPNFLPRKSQHLQLDPVAILPHLVGRDYQLALLPSIPKRDPKRNSQRLHVTQESFRTWFSRKDPGKVNQSYGKKNSKQLLLKTQGVIILPTHNI